MTHKDIDGMVEEFENHLMDMLSDIGEAPAPESVATPARLNSILDGLRTTLTSYGNKCRESERERIRNSVLTWVTEESGGLSNEQLSLLDDALTKHHE